MSINQVQRPTGDVNSDNKYALMEIDKKVTVRGLVDSGVSRCAIDEDICSRYNINIIDKKRTLSHFLDKFMTSGIAVISLAIGSQTHKVEADVMPLKSERFILGTKDFSKFGFSLQGDGLLPRSETESVIEKSPPCILVINSVEASTTKEQLIVKTDNETSLDKLLNS